MQVTNNRTTVEVSRNEGGKWSTWAYYDGTPVKAYQTCAKLRKLYPEFIFRVVKPKGPDQVSLA